MAMTCNSCAHKAKCPAVLSHGCVKWQQGEVNLEIVRKSGATYKSAPIEVFDRCDGCAFFKGIKKACKKDAEKMCLEYEIIWKKVK